MTHSFHDPDQVLVNALASGDARAFEEIYRKYARELFYYVRKNISAREDAEEIIQEVFESLWLRRDDIDIRTTLRAYLQGMVRYKIVHHFRKSALRKKYLEHFALFEAVYEETGGDDIDALQETLNRLISDLPERCQLALRLRLSEKLSNQDIARRMNITTRTVETYIYRAFTHIRDAYRSYAGKM